METTSKGRTWKGHTLFPLDGDTYYSTFQHRGVTRRRYWIETACSQCDAPMFRDRNNHRRGGRPCCSKGCADLCRGRGRTERKFKRGSQGGHVLRRAEGHPRTDRHGFVPEHRLVMEEQLGRYLEPHEVVHHIECDPQNNDPENLVLCPSNSEHNLAHASINPCIAPLLKAGVIRFNRETLRYETVPGS